MAVFVRRSGSGEHRATERRPVPLSTHLVTIAAPQRPDLPDRIAGRTRRGGRERTRLAQSRGARRAAQDRGRAPKPPGRLRAHAPWPKLMSQPPTPRRDRGGLVEVSAR